MDSKRTLDVSRQSLIILLFLSTGFVDCKFDKINLEVSSPLMLGGACVVG